MMKLPRQSHFYKIATLIGAPFLFFGAIGAIIYSILGFFLLADLIDSHSRCEPDGNI